MNTRFQKQQTMELNFENCDIDSLDDLLADWSKNEKLQVLRLANNNLSKLPLDMAMLKHVEYLDLSANPFLGAEFVIPGLASMPKLKHLYIDFNEKDEDDCIVALSKLESFNGTRMLFILVHSLFYQNCLILPFMIPKHHPKPNQQVKMLKNSNKP